MEYPEIFQKHKEIYYFFNINNIKILNKMTFFSIFLFSYCPIDFKIYFNIFFENIVSNCVFSPNISYSMKKINEKKIAYCVIKGEIQNLDDFLFPKASTEYLDINLIMNNYRKYIPIIFKDFYCENQNNCILKAIFFKETKKNQKN